MSGVTASPFASRDTHCIEPGCTSPRSAKGRCTKHYQAMKAGSDGIVSGFKKLTDEQCVAIRKRSSQFATNAQIAREFGVANRTIADVLKRRGAYAERVTA